MSTPLNPLSLAELDELLRHFSFRKRIDSIVLRLVRSAAQVSSAQPPAQLSIDRQGLLRPIATWGDLGSTFVIDVAASPDAGEALDVQQQSTLLEAIARIQQRFDLPIDAAQIADGGGRRAALSPKDVGKLATPETLKGLRADLALRRKAAAATARETNFPFSNGMRPVWSLIEQLKGDATTHRRLLEITGRAVDSLYRDLAPLPATLAPEVSRELGDLSPALLNDLRPHIVNLTEGRFSEDGDFTTSPSDVDAIFDVHLLDWARSRPGDEPIRIMLYAHGGLVSEESGLAIAANQIEWWKDNGIYPIHFVWETGLLETLGQILNPDRTRAIDLAAPTDFLLEEIARRVGGVTIWSGMKRNAERASDKEGGARYLADKLALFCKRPEVAGRIELHAVGHSAGSIFHSHLLPAALDIGVPAFKSLHLLAPAIRVDAFLATLAPRIGTGKGIDRVTMFTMAKPFELADNCAFIYRKSLLYLIRAALEAKRRTAILGLEESLRKSAELKRLFNLDGQGAGNGDIVFSVTNSDTGRNASRSSSHGGFDNDPPTMNSMARRILDRDDIKPFEDLSRDALLARDAAAAMTFRAQVRGATRPAAAPVIQTAVPSAPGPISGGGGRKRALCIGINRYPTAPLGGCVNDAQLWARTLTMLGFSTELLLDEDATRDAMRTRLELLIQQSRAGDTVVFQFAGHGTKVPDVNGDEPDGIDEAICPVDFASGRLLIDDDIGEICDRIPEGVNVTLFTDCCHSGTISRLGIGMPAATIGANQRARFVVASEETKRAHVRDRSGATRALRSAGAPRREILFCACRDIEVALESDGHGDFTTRAVPLVSSALGSVSNDQFVQQVIRAFGSAPRQNPELHCSAELRAAGFLQPSVSAGGAAPQTGADKAAVRRALEIVSAAALGVTA